MVLNAYEDMDDMIEDVTTFTNEQIEATQLTGAQVLKMTNKAWKKRQPRDTVLAEEKRMRLSARASIRRDLKAIMFQLYDGTVEESTFDKLVKEIKKEGIWKKKEG